MSAIGRRIDRAEAAVAPSHKVLVYDCGDDVPAAEQEIFVRDVLKPRRGDIVIMLRDFIDRLSPPRLPRDHRSTG